MPDTYDTSQKRGGATGRCSVHVSRDAFTVLEKYPFLLNDANGLSFPGARRFAAAALAEHNATGLSVFAVSAHFVPHADNPQGGITTMPRGRKAVIPAIEALIHYCGLVDVDVVVIGGDFNVDQDRDLAHLDNGLVERMAAAGFISDGAALGDGPDTHGRNEYDWLLVSGAHFIAPRTVHPRRRSDHRAKTCTITTVQEDTP